ncbi:MAG: GNAT family N-acetyltransferase [Crocinitomicaceae bacterium]|nr:GNAT family N-acetyltransferase [Crocinitomicaceae bacterium]
MECIKGFGLELHPLSEDLLETVRQWRNNQFVAQYMEFQEEISVESQQKWFQSIENAHYFVIFSENKPIGLIDVKKIDYQSKTAESGLFIGDSTFIGSGIALGASILLLDYAFTTLKLENVTAKINKNNKVAEQYNQLLGFQKTQAINDLFDYWVLSKENYQQKRPTLVKIVDPYSASSL